MMGPEEHTAAVAGSLDFSIVWLTWSMSGFCDTIRKIAYSHARRIVLKPSLAQRFEHAAMCLLCKARALRVTLTT